MNMCIYIHMYIYYMYIHISSIHIYIYIYIYISLHYICFAATFRSFKTYLKVTVLLRQQFVVTLKFCFKNSGVN